MSQFFSCKNTLIARYVAKSNFRDIEPTKPNNAAKYLINTLFHVNIAVARTVDRTHVK